MEHSVFYPCFLQCTAIEQEDNVLVEKLEVKGEILEEFDEPLPSVFINGQEIRSSEGLEYTASVALPGQCWHLHRHKDEWLYSCDGMVIPHIEELGLDLKLVNHSEFDSEIVVMATGDTNGRVRNFFVRIPANETYTVCLDPLRDYDDLHLISWQPFDASLETDNGTSKESVPITVQSPQQVCDNRGKYVSYCQERYVYKRFSGSYLFGYFEHVIGTERKGEFSLHIFWPNHGEILHTRYQGVVPSRKRPPVRVAPEILANWFGEDAPGYPAEEEEPTIYLVSDMSGSDFLPSQAEVHDKVAARL